MYANELFVLFRNLCRALRISSTDPFYNMNRSIYESFCLAFLSNLDADSGRHVQKLIEKVIFTNAKLVNLLKSSVELPHPLCLKYVKVDDCPYPIVKGTNETHLDETYIRTDTVKKNLQDISRIIFAGKTLPILLQGETSVGKTSLITWLAKATGNVCYRVNNHEHTDLQVSRLIGFLEISINLFFLRFPRNTLAVTVLMKMERLFSKKEFS